MSNAGLARPMDIYYIKAVEDKVMEHFADPAAKGLCKNNSAFLGSVADNAF
jgi:hypothetical protein